MVPRIEIARDGPVFSRLVQGYWRLGQWELTPSQMQAFIEAHLELGITTVDHASVYGPPSCERQFGEAIKQRPSLRHRLEIVSKCGVVPPEAGKVGHYDSSRQSIIESVERSLQNLCTDFLDLLLIHRPDFKMQTSEVAEAFTKQELVVSFYVTKKQPLAIEKIWRFEHERVAPATTICQSRHSRHTRTHTCGRSRVTAS